MRSENGNAKVKLIVIILIIFLVIYGVYVYKKGSNKKRDFLDEENKVVYRENDFDQTFRTHKITGNFTFNNDDDENKVSINTTSKNLNSTGNISRDPQVLK